MTPARAPIPRALKILFYLFAGAVLPVVLLIADPILFKGGDMVVQAVLPTWQPFFYALYAASILALLAALFAPLPASAARFVSGALFVGFLAALVTGLALLPYSLFGLLIGVGVLGFAPFLTAWIYYTRSKAIAASAGFDKAKLAGAFASVAIAVLSQVSVEAYLGPRLALAQSRDPAIALPAVEALNNEPLCGSLCHKRLCDSNWTIEAERAFARPCPLPLD